MDQPIQPLDYRTPPPLAPFRFPTRWTTAVAAATFVVVLVALITRRKFEGIFRDFRMQLPGSTMLVLRFSRWFTDDFGWLIAALLAVALLAGGILVASLRPSAFGEGRERWAARAVWLLALACAGFAIYALLVPMMTVLDAVHGK